MTGQQQNVEVLKCSDELRLHAHKMLAAAAPCWYRPPKPRLVIVRGADMFKGPFVT